MLHLDLFSGIGGFAYAIDQVWPNVEHIFCDNDKFCQQVLKKHWPNSKIYGNIRTLTNTKHDGRDGTKNSKSGVKRTDDNSQGSEKLCQSQRSDTLRSSVDLLTGGFPCQPFSQAGRRKGTQDDRYLWPEMYRVIREFSPRWVVAENVRGLLNIQGGLVFEQVCLDMESAGYEVQPFIIPAVAVNAPHRRDRVWFIANRKDINEEWSEQSGSGRRKPKEEARNGDSNAQNTISKRSGGRLENKRQILESQSTEVGNERPSWERNWLEVATELCGMDDGLPAGMDFAGWSKAQHRVQRLKALGNSIVPQVAVEIFKAIKNL